MQNDFYTTNADGSNETCITNDSAMDAYPAWSPNGKKIAFASFRADANGAVNEDIYSINANGAAEKRLTDNPSTET